MNYTVIGGRGFIGSKIVELLENQKETVWVPNRYDPQLFDRELGIVIYCAGHGDCDNGFLKVLEANTTLLSKFVNSSNFNKLVYISSTRVYMGQNSSSESDDLTVLAQDARRLFNLTKLVAEEILLKSKKDIAIVRPSNVYGLALNSPLFLASIVRNAINNGVVDMYVSPEYSKDYVSVDDVANLTIKISKDQNVSGQIFNVAAGKNVSAKQIAQILQSKTQCKVCWHANSQDEKFPPTSIAKIKEKFNYKPSFVLDDLVDLINNYQHALTSND
jgi:nucleoside-diphosphate-sugar epimerase